MDTTTARTLTSHPYTAACECGEHTTHTTRDSAATWAHTHETACGGATEYWR